MLLLIRFGLYIAVVILDIYIPLCFYLYEFDGHWYKCPT